MSKKLLDYLKRERKALKARYTAELRELDVDIQAIKSIKSVATERSKGGIARAKKLTPERRSEIAKQAAKKRWSK